MNTAFEAVSGAFSPEGSATTLVCTKDGTPRASSPLGPGAREALLVALSGAMFGARAAGDVEGARVVYEAIGRLLAAPMQPSEVVDLARERERRGR
jgi:hypothetical protein